MTSPTSIKTKTTITGGCVCVLTLDSTNAVSAPDAVRR